MSSTSVIAPFALKPLKTWASRKVFAFSNIKRIHIIGCSRSGTTMLQLAMCCFERTKISDDETDIEHPYLTERLQIALKEAWRPGTKFYVTKRAHSWFQPERLERLIRAAQVEDIGLIHMVRDPRDVALSRYAGSNRPYVSAEHWHRSIQAADKVFGALSARTKRLVLRYEDLVLDPAGAQKKIEDVFGMRQNPSAYSIDRVRDNFLLANLKFKEDALQALKGLRNADAASIGLWRKNRAAALPWSNIDAIVHARLTAFVEEYGYEPI